MYIGGDFNLNLFNLNNMGVQNFVNMMHSRDLYCLINKTTRLSSASASLIDNVWTNDYFNCIKNGIIFDSSSDHFPVFSIFSYDNSECNKDEEYLNLEYRDFSQENISKFKTKLHEVNWDLIFVSRTVDVADDNLILIFSNMFNRYFPMITKKNKK